MRRLILAAALLPTACGPNQSPAPDIAAPGAAPGAASAPSIQPSAATAPGGALSARGWGPLRIGMTKAEAVAALGAGEAGADANDSCEQYHPARAPAGVLAMMEDGRLTRISIIEMSTIKTDRGLGLGDSAAAVKAAYGAAAKATPHKYQESPAEYVTVWEGAVPATDYVEDPAARGLVYEIDGTGKVGAIHAGGPSIQYVEGCA